MKTTTTQPAPSAPVACLCCRKARATWMVKDNGFKVYPACHGCKKCLIVVEAKRI